MLVAKMKVEAFLSCRKTGHSDMPFCSCDLDLDPMTLIYEPDLNIPEMYLCTKNEVSRARLSKVKSPNMTDTQTDRQD